MAKFEQHRAYLERALTEVTRTHDELETRVEALKEQMVYLEDAIKALTVYEHIDAAAIARASEAVPEEVV